jgi:hypothetical protein
MGQNVNLELLLDDAPTAVGEELSIIDKDL